ncbi:MAG TPA: hypothetical protein VKB35_03190 [Ktedonobacteraceae bacterium]|nr:hypothetical protein [Ktedonobacteraceae bacterium]
MVAISSFLLLMQHHKPFSAMGGVPPQVFPGAVRPCTADTTDTSDTSDTSDTNFLEDTLEKRRVNSGGIYCAMVIVWSSIASTIAGEGGEVMTRRSSLWTRDQRSPASGQWERVTKQLMIAMLFGNRAGLTMMGGGWNGLTPALSIADGEGASPPLIPTAPLL